MNGCECAACRRKDPKPATGEDLAIYQQIADNFWRDKKTTDLERQVAAEKERADYAWRNTNVIEKGYQEELAKRDALTAQVAALTKENERLQTACNRFSESEILEGNQLAASQAREQKLRDLLGAYLEQVSGYDGRTSQALEDEIIEALALPQDDTALQERLKAEREKIIDLIRHNYFSISNLVDIIRRMT